MGLFRKDKTSERLDELNTFIESEWKPAADESAASSRAESTREQLARRLDTMLDQQGIAGSMRAQLRRADLKLTVVEYLILHVVLAAALAVTGWIITHNVVGAGLGLILGFVLPRIYVGIKQGQRLKAFEDELPDILNLWVNSLRAGYSVPQAMEAVGKEAPPPASDEFRRVVSEFQIGIPVDIALNNMLARIGSEDLDLVFTAVNIQREVGGNLAEILETISHTIRERIRIKGEIKTLTASGRASGTLVGSLPLGLALLLYVMNPNYMGQLFFGPPVGANIPGLDFIPCGWPIIAVGLIMMGTGAAIIARIIDIEV
jgi:tight adherence protein B